VSIDTWGVPRQAVTLQLGEVVEQYQEVTSSPLARAETVAEVEAYAHWPSPGWFDYTVIEAQCDAVLARDKVVVFMGDRLNRVAQLKPAMYLCGVDTILSTMALSPGLAHAVFSRIRAFYLEYLQRILQAGRGKIDIVCTGDDFGAQNSLLLSASMWHEFLEAGFRAYVELAHAFGARVMHHTCGAVEPLVPAMIDCGLDILQSLQPEACGMDPYRLKQRYGDVLCFQGGVSIQRTLPYGSLDQIRSEVQHLAQTLGRGGGYVFGTAHNIQADTTVESVQELLRAYHEFGRY
jgi:uroporphyrinogen decarboxylase